MNIYLFVDRYKPYPLSSARMIEDLSNNFLLENHNITVITTDHKIKEKYEISDDKGIRVVRVKTLNINQRSKVIRSLIEISLSGLIWKNTKNIFKYEKIDLIICYSPTIFWAGLLEKIKKISDAKVYLVLRDLFPQWALDTGVISKYNPMYWYFKSVEIKLYKSVDRIGVQSEKNKEYFLGSKFINKVEVLYNWIRIRNEINSNLSFRKRMKLEDKIILVYGGNIGIAQDIGNILRLAKKLLPHKKPHILIIGRGTEYKKVKNIIENDNLLNVTLLDSMDNKDYISIMSNCDIGLISLNKDFKTENFPGKMMEYMNSGLPILASINKGNNFNELMHHHNAGLVSINGDDNDLYNNAINLIDNNSLREDMGKQAFKLLKNKFNVEVAAKQILIGKS